LSQVFIESGLFEAAGLTDDMATGPDESHGLRMLRRLLVLSYLLAGGVDGAEGDAACMASVKWWAARGHAYRDWRPATLTTILFQLQALGPVVDFEETAGGFHVQLREGQL